MDRPPRHRDEPLLSRFLLWRIVFVSVILVLGVFGVFIGLRQAGADLETARTAAVNTLVLFELFYLLNTRRLHSSPFSGLFTRQARILWTAIAAVVIFQLLFTYAPVMQWLFQSRPLGLLSWGICLAVAMVVFLLVELEKFLRRRSVTSR